MLYGIRHDMLYELPSTRAFSPGRLSDWRVGRGRVIVAHVERGHVHLVASVATAPTPSTSCASANVSIAYYVVA